MEIRQLECFVKTAELGNFTKAADLLHISQPALSNNIALLERSLGLKLFDRHGKRVTLNSNGANVLAHAREILDQRNQIYTYCQLSKNEPKNRVSIRMTAASEYITNILSDLRSAHPEIAVQTYQNSGTMSQEDVDILVFASIQKHSYTTDHSVLCESLALAVPQGHPLYERDSVSMSEIASHPVISLRTGNDMRMLEDHYLEQAGVCFYREVECDVPATMRSLLRGGFGIGLVPTITWKLQDSQLRLIPIRDYECIRYINVHLPHPERINKNVDLVFHRIETFFQEIS